MLKGFLHCIVSSLNCDHFYNQILFKNYYLGIHYFPEWYHHNSKGRQIYKKKHMNKNSRVHALKHMLSIEIPYWEEHLQNNNSDSKEIQSCHSLHQDIFYYNAFFDHFQGQLTKLLFHLWHQAMSFSAQYSRTWKSAMKDCQLGRQANCVL